MQRRIRVPRLWKYSAGLALSFSVLIVGAVEAARLAPHPGCVNLSTSTLDLLSGRLFEERSGRVAVTLQSWYSPDFRHRAYLEESAPQSPDRTLYIWSGETRSATAVQDGIREPAVSPNWDGQVSWSPDNRRIAFVWEALDGQAYLLVANRDGSDKRVAPITLEGGAPAPNMLASIGGWSADGDYLALAYGASSQLTGMRFAFWSLTDMRPVATPLDGLLLPKVAWSTQGHRLAAVSQDERKRVFLHFVALEGGVRQQRRFLSDMPNHVAWSPDGAYLVLATLRRDGAAYRWYYDIYRSDGTLLFAEIEADRRGLTEPQPHVFRADWSANSPSWVYLREREQAGETVTDLMALDVSTGEHRVVASDLVRAFLDDMFFTPPNQKSDDPTWPLLYPTGSRVVIPRWEHGKITVELADWDGANRLTLVEGADELGGYDSRSGRAFWSWGGDTVQLIWAAGEGARLILARPDGSDLHTLDDGLEDIVNLQPASFRQGWWGYLGQRDGVYGLEIFRPQSGERYRLLSDLEPQNDWSLIPYRGRDLMAVTVQATRSSPGEIVIPTRALFITSLDGSGAREIAPEMFGHPAWSPDGTKLAYLRYNFQRQPVLEIVTAEGARLERRVLSERREPGTWLSAWTMCN